MSEAKKYEVITQDRGSGCERHSLKIMAYSAEDAYFQAKLDREKSSSFSHIVAVQPREFRPPFLMTLEQTNKFEARTIYEQEDHVKPAHGGQCAVCARKGTPNATCCRPGPAPNCGFCYIVSPI